MEKEKKLKDGEKGAVLQRDKQTYAIAPHRPGRHPGGGHRCGLAGPGRYPARPCRKLYQGHRPVGKKNGWVLTVGGKGTSKPRLADTLAEDLDTDQALALIEKVIAFYQENAKKHERIGKMIDRLELDAVQAAVL